MRAIDSSRAVTVNEASTLELLRNSLGGWCLGDIKKAASPDVNLPRLAFVGLAAWVDTVAILYSGGKKRGKTGLDAWEEFIARSGYLPNRMCSKREVRRLYDGLRNALLHEYGTREVALTSGVDNSDDHWSLMPDTQIRVLHLESLIATFEAAFEQFLSALESDAVLRARVLPAAGGLLAPVLASESTSISNSIARIVAPRTIAASATGPLEPPKRP
jgi:hypothetical protein